MRAFNARQIRAKSTQNRTGSSHTQPIRKYAPVNTPVHQALPPDEQTQVDKIAHSGSSLLSPGSLAHIPIFPPDRTDDNHSLSSQRHMRPGAVIDAATSGTGSEVPYRKEMEQAFNEDFSTIKSHLGQSTKISSLGAYAATRGEHIIFAANHPGRKEVAHELVHIVQNRRGGTLTRSDNTVTPSNHPAEREAESQAPQIIAGNSVAVTAQPGGTISLGKYKVKDKVILSETYGNATGEILQVLSGSYKIKLSSTKTETVDEDDITGLAGQSGKQQSSGAPSLKATGSKTTSKGKKPVTLKTSAAQVESDEEVDPFPRFKTTSSAARVESDEEVDPFIFSPTATTSKGKKPVTLKTSAAQVESDEESDLFFPTATTSKSKKPVTLKTSAARVESDEEVASFPRFKTTSSAARVESDEEVDPFSLTETTGQARQTQMEGAEGPSETKKKQSKNDIRDYARTLGIGAHVLRGHFLDDNALKSQAKLGENNFKWASEDRLFDAVKRATSAKKGKVVEIDITPADGYGIKYEGATDTYYKVYPKKARVAFKQRGDFKTAYGVTENNDPDDKTAYHGKEEL